MSKMLEKIRKLNWVLQEASKGSLSFDELCKILRDLTNSNVYIIDVNGVILGVAYKDEEDSSAIIDPDTGVDVFSKEYTESLNKITESKINVQGEQLLQILKDEIRTKNKYHMIIPIQGDQRWGTVLMARYEPEFTEEDLVLAEVGATGVGLEIKRQKMQLQQEEEREENVVKMAIRTLSYSEAEAVQKIFEELNDMEGILVASRIADKSRITRSVIVNALRKLESAGVIEAKSLGMKGTHIKVLNNKFYQQLDAMK